jgi:hypothetical protein
VNIQGMREAASLDQRMTRIPCERFQFIDGDRIADVSFAIVFTGQGIGHCASKVRCVFTLEICARIGEHPGVHPVHATLYRTQQSPMPATPASDEGT